MPSRDQIVFMTGRRQRSPRSPQAQSRTTRTGPSEPDRERTDLGAEQGGDVPSVGKAYVVTAPNPEVTTDQVAGFPTAAGQAVRELVEEYEARQSPEARLAKDADKLECLIQAREYQAQGHEDVPPWIETSAAALCTPLGPPACRGVPAGATATVVESLRGVVPEAVQGDTPAIGAGPSERSRAAGLVGA